MKFSKLILGMGIAISSNAAEICSNSEGSYFYESATSVGQSVVVVKPRIIIAGKPVLIQAYTGAPAETYYGNGFCRAIGMKSGIVSDVEAKPANEMLAQLNQKGQLIAFGNNVGYYGIKTVTCRK